MSENPHVSGDLPAATGALAVAVEPASSLAPSGFDPAIAERPWQPWERNFSGGRIGVQEQQGANENWMIVHVESGGAKTTTSLRLHEAWDFALMVSPQVKARLNELHDQVRDQRDALHALTYRSADTDLLRQIADEHDCGHDCDYAGSYHCPKIDRDGCDLADADSLRNLAKAIDIANEATCIDVLAAIDSCGDSKPTSESDDWQRGYNDALAAAEREVRRLFDRTAGSGEG